MGRQLGSESRDEKRQPWQDDMGQYLWCPRVPAHGPSLVVREGMTGETSGVFVELQVSFQRRVNEVADT